MSVLHVTLQVCINFLPVIKAAITAVVLVVLVQNNVVRDSHVNVFVNDDFVHLRDDEVNVISGKPLNEAKAFVPVLIFIHGKLLITGYAGLFVVFE
jgi:hypothetical protein